MPRILCVCCLVVPGLALAQEPKRKIEGELSGNLFFGNTRQVLASVRAEHERVDSAFALRLLSRFNYGQTTTDQAGTIVSKRSWNAGASYDWRPFSDFAPFIRTALESSFENRIARRYSGGTGSRINVVRTPGTEAVLRIGVDAERTEPSGPGDTVGTTTLARGVSSLRMRRDFSARVSATSETSYQPALTRSGDFTIQSVTALKIKLASFAGLTLTFRDNYDSRSVARGARTNNDGELLVGILTTF